MVIDYTSYPEAYRELFAQATEDLNNFYNSYCQGNSNEANYQKIVNGKLITVDEEELQSIIEAVKKYKEEEEDLQIDSLEDYFSVLQLLTLSFDTNYQILPLEEPVFEINLNTRTITLPSGNYIYAVSGDNMAETIYFKTDRYFDNVDLNEMDIAVLVKTTEGTYLIPATVRDITTYSDKIIFGWPISTEITKKAETIEFSVRFFKEDQENLVYDLSTTTNKLQIKQGLNNGTEFKEIDLGSRAKNLLKNYPQYGTANVLPPEILFYSWKDTEGLEDSENETVNKFLYVVAQKEEDKLDYKWYSVDKDNISKEVAPSDSTDEYIEFPESEQENIAQYIDYLYKYDAESGEYVKVNGIDETTTAYYLLNKNTSSFSAAAPARYYCVATAGNNLRTNSSSTPYYTIYAPGTPSYLEDLPGQFMLNEGQKLNKDLFNDSPYLLNKKYYTVTNEDMVEKTGKISLEVCDLPGGSAITNPTTIKAQLMNFLNGEYNKSEAVDITVYPALNGDNPYSFSQKNANSLISLDSQYIIQADQTNTFENLVNVTLKSIPGVDCDYSLKYTDASSGTETVLDKSKNLAFGISYSFYVSKKPQYRDIKDNDISGKEINTNITFKLQKAGES